MLFSDERFHLITVNAVFLAREGRELHVAVTILQAVNWHSGKTHIVIYAPTNSKYSVFTFFENIFLKKVSIFSKRQVHNCDFGLSASSIRDTSSIRCITV